MHTGRDLLRSGSENDQYPAGMLVPKVHPVCSVESEDFFCRALGELTQRYFCKVIIKIIFVLVISYNSLIGFNTF